MQESQQHSSGAEDPIPLLPDAEPPLKDATHQLRACAPAFHPGAGRFPQAGHAPPPQPVAPQHPQPASQGSTAARLSAQPALSARNAPLLFNNNPCTLGDGCSCHLAVEGAPVVVLPPNISVGGAYTKVHFTEAQLALPPAPPPPQDLAPSQQERQSAGAGAAFGLQAAAGAPLKEAAQQLRATAPAFCPSSGRFVEAVAAVQRVWRGRVARQQLEAQQLAARRLAACTRAVAIMRWRPAVAACTRAISTMRRRPMLAACAEATFYMRQRQAIAACNEATSFMFLRCALHP